VAHHRSCYGVERIDPILRVAELPKERSPRRAGRIVRRPFIDLLQQHSARTGFFERDECDAVLARLPEDLQAVFAVAYLTG